tara:strand:+ start:4709 stop:5734 length:1026 start_codon:yes stop_codon:yes gene_type:complete
METPGHSADGADGGRGGPTCARATTTSVEMALNPFTRDEELWAWYKRAEASFWTVEEVDLAQDKRDWDTLSDNERSFVKNVLSFFASSDIVVADNALLNFCEEVPEREAKFFYGFQCAMENIHSEMYLELILAYVADPNEQRRLLDVATTDCVTREKVAWMQKWMDPTRNSFLHRLVAFACVEGIFFSASFCSIFWLRKRGKMPGLCFSNELIARDEGMHRDFAVLQYNRKGGIPEQDVVDIVSDAVRVETRFVHESLPVRLIGMNADSMAQYVRFVADHLLVSMGHAKLYASENPFDWMELISLAGKTNFFEKRVPEYQMSGVGQSAQLRQRDLVLDSDF